MGSQQKMTMKPSTSDLIMNTIREMPPDKKGHSVISVKKAIIDANPDNNNTAFVTRFNKAINTMLEKNLLTRPKGSVDSKGATGRIKLGESKPHKEKQKGSVQTEKENEGTSSKKATKEKGNEENISKKSAAGKDGKDPKKNPKKPTVKKAAKVDNDDAPVEKRNNTKKASTAETVNSSGEDAKKEKPKKVQIQNSNTKQQENDEGPAEEPKKPKAGPKSRTGRGKKADEPVEGEPATKKTKGKGKN
ncbi:hypothetical protein BIW11_09070 [Tropilaelaps mercedesae]|uniref:H15 domain-containing protein n=1 Tax=Tropilaelaps mercedesae TaxID=418985 RepID=A0A1V9XLR0_9ACAR|nr:hypothetical protein BIW11_09070 [Tropilaelaps mercedesae]